LPGQYGALTALPLMFEVIDSLPGQRAERGRRAPPPDVREVEVCWPLGIAADAQPAALCQRRMRAWTLDGVVPPTFAERGARVWSAGRERFERDLDTGQRVSAACSLPHRTGTVEIARWPALATPWLSQAVRAASTLPPLADDCMADGRDADATLQIEGIADGAVLSPPPGHTGGIRVSLRALGAEGRVQWLLDGRWLAESRGNDAVTVEVSGTGPMVLTALADSGAWASLQFRALPPPR
jgi:penicillin-binding protein 1C